VAKDNPGPGKGRRRGWRVWLRRLGPVVVTGVVLFFILRKYPLTKITGEMANGNWLPLIPIALLASVSTLLLVCCCDFLVINGFLNRPRYRDVLRGKAGTSMLQLIGGYGVGQGGYAVWIARATGATVGQAAGVGLYTAASDLCALCVVTTVAIYGVGADVPRALAITAPAIGGVLVFFALIGPSAFVGEVPAVFQPWRNLTRKRQLANIAGRCVNISLGVVLTWWATQAFGLNIPFAVMASYLPIIILVGAMPVNIGGFGPVQAMWLVFEPWASGPAILAFEFLWKLGLGAGLVVRGLPFIRQCIAEIELGPKNPARLAAEAEPSPGLD